MVEAKKTKERKLEKEILGVLVFLGALIVVFLIASSYFKSLNSFEYEGLAFTKKRVGDLQVYHHNYYLKVGQKLINYNLYLRHDPRENNVTVVGAKSELLAPGAVAYVSVNSDGLQECRFGALAIGTISSFLSDNQMNIIGGNLNFWDAGARRDQWVTCENRPGNRVVEIVAANETRVVINRNCYRIEVANCQILEAVEKLEVQSLVDTRRSN
ncbi:MAG: hypothetical protein ACP5NS_04570 [Candidatus Pacearchaeota archaeon]